MTTNPVISITDEQIAEIEALAKECKSQGDWYKDFDFTSFPEFDCDASFVKLCGPDYALALISRLRAAEMDAARLDKIQQLFNSSRVHPANYGSPYTRWGYAYHHPYNMPFCLHGETFREAIDNAMKGDQQ